MQQKSLQKGFTLIELLVVIAILAILSVAVILTLNPAQLLEQARDSERISDMAALKSAISLYLVDVATPNLGTSTWCYSSFAFAASAGNGCTARMTASTLSTTSAANAASTTGNGWIPINFAAISAGAPFGTEPIDPINNITYFYSFASNSTTLQFEIDAKMESTKFASDGGSDVESKDGGTSSSVYEAGTNLAL